MSRCPDPDSLRNYATASDVSDEVRSQVQLHVSTCEECRRAVSEVARTVAVPPKAPDADAAPPSSTFAPLPPGTKVGRYTVVAQIGAGAMGVVYAAHDPELDRRVAIKLVRASTRGSARSRLQREARAIARLSDPNVVGVYDVGTFGGDVFLAMELVEGGTLRDAIEDRKPPWRETLALFLQAGRGLAAAHAVGIVHRDFKPDNVLLGKDGRVRVGDFGLARDAGDEVDSGQWAPSDSLDATATEAGTVLGTPAYMAPEQMRGERTDERADVFAFCVALYEALYGLRPFEGSNFGELRHHVEGGDVRPPPADTQVPSAIHTLLARGLATRPADRWQSMSELLVALERQADPLRANRRRFPAMAALLAGAVGVAGGALVLRGRSHAPGVPPPVASASTPPAAPPFDPVDLKRLTFGYGCEEFPVWTPSGKAIVFDGAVGRDSQIFVLDAEGGTPRAITSGSGWRYAPSLSPDGLRVAFLFSEGSASGTFIAPMDGSAAPARVGDSGVRPSWALDGSCVWTGHGTARCVDPVSGSVSRTVAPPPGYDVLSVRPLPGGDVVAAFLETEGRLPRGLAVYAAGSDEPRWLTRETLEEVLLPTPDGRAVIVAHSLHNEHVELWRLALDGSGNQIVSRPDLQPTKGLSYAPATDRIVWSTCGTDPDIVALAPAGAGVLRAQPIFPSFEWNDDEPTWLQGTSLMVVTSDRTEDGGLWIIDRKGLAAPREISLGGVRAAAPSASPAGDAIAFASPDGGIYVVGVDGSSPPRRLTRQSGDGSPSFGRDGKTVYFERTESGTQRVYSVQVDGGEERPALPPRTSAPAASFRTDVVAYLEQAEGREERRPMVLDLSTGRTRPLAPKLGLGAFRALRLSPSASRAAVLTGESVIIEVDLGTGAETARFDAGGDQITGMTYVGPDIVAARWVWKGDLWIGRAPFR